VTDLVAATEAAVEAADHLTDMDKAAVEAMLALARKIDAWDVIVDYALDDMAGIERGGRPAVPQNDNVSISAYLKFCESLGLTPAGRAKLVEQKKPEGAGGKLASLQAQAAKRRSA
jgi:hypothetical protein